MTSTRIYAPSGTRGSEGTPLAPLPPRLAGKRIMALDNGKPGASDLLDQLARQLAARTGADFLGARKKGSAATPCEDELLEEIAGSADIVMTGTAD